MLVQAGSKSEFKTIDTGRGYIEERILPLTGGRSSVSEAAQGNLLSMLAMIEPDTPFGLLDIMEGLSKYNADFSYAVDNIVQLANTKFTVTFDDSVEDEQAKEMNLILKRAWRHWYNQSEGISALAGDMFSQMAITGALSAEMVPKMNLKGIEKVVLVNPKYIRFQYDKDTDANLPYQVVHGIHVDMTGMKPLNVLTYKYFALRRLNDKPYAIPPMASALENVAIEKDMMDNMRRIIKKLGLLGFLQVLVTPPPRQPNEPDQKYVDRCKMYLDAVIPQMEKSMSKGYVAGFKNTHEFKMDSILGNVSSAKTLFDLNGQVKMAGLKQDPLMLGRNFSTTETLGRVILAKLTTQVGAYQKSVAGFMEQLFEMHLLLSGFKFEYLQVEFEPAMVGDKLRDEQVFEIKLVNLKALYDQGIISQDQFAIEAGYEEPDEEEPRAGANPFGGGGLPGDDPTAEIDPVTGKPVAKKPGTKKPKPDGKKDDATNPKTTAVKSQIKAKLVSLAVEELERELGGDFSVFEYKEPNDSK
jgi:hypothetical protein